MADARILRGSAAEGASLAAVILAASALAGIVALSALAPAAAQGTGHSGPPPSRAAKILEGAYAQVGVTTIYDGRYVKIPYPGGDVPLERGVCCDVVVRAYRHAGLDLQQLVHEDMARAFGAYPRIWGLSRPDANIDHRRVPNLATFFTRCGTRLPVTSRAQDYLPADIVTWRLISGAAHVGLVSDRMETGRPLCIHNVGAGTRLEDVLFAYEVTGHFRYDPRP